MNLETALDCFQVMSYVNSVAIGIILEHNWVPHQCSYITGDPQKLQRIFCNNFANYPCCSLHLTFPFHSSKSTTVTPQSSRIINFMGLYACQFFRFNFFILILEGFFIIIFLESGFLTNFIFFFFVFVEHILSDLGGPSLF